MKSSISEGFPLGMAHPCGTYQVPHPRLFGSEVVGLVGNRNDAPPYSPSTGFSLVESRTLVYRTYVSILLDLKESGSNPHSKLCGGFLKLCAGPKLPICLGISQEFRVTIKVPRMM